MKIVLDRAKCEGYGNCVLAEPEVFDLDDDGLVKLLIDDVPESLRDRVKYAVRECPVRALALED